MSEAESDRSPPFFVVGAQRSGTTMLRLMLNRHSRLFVPFESRFIPEFAAQPDGEGAALGPAEARDLLDRIRADEFVRKGNLVPDPDSVLNRKPISYAELVDAIFTTRARQEGKARWGDKTPSYVLEMDCLWHLFPGCRFVHLIRDGRDVACSLRRLAWGTRDLVRSAQDWRWKVLMGRKMGAMVPQNYAEVRYERLVRQPAETLQTICRFLGERYEPTMLEYHLDAESNLPRQSLQWHRNSVSAPDPDQIGRWRSELDAADLRVFEDVAGDLLATLGYTRSDPPRTLTSRVRYAKYALFGHA
jgi:hypothetical protein